MALVFLYFLKSIKSSSLFSGSAIRIVAVQSLSGREKVAVIEVGEEQILIGIGQAGITKLHTLKDKLVFDAAAAPANASPLALYIRNIMSKGLSK